MVQIALILDEHSARSPLIDYAIWWQQREAAEYLCWVRNSAVPMPKKAVPAAGTATKLQNCESMHRVLDLRLRNVTYFQDDFNPEVVHRLGHYVDLIGLCRHQFGRLGQAIELGHAAVPACPVFVPNGFPPTSQVLIHLNADAVKAAQGLAPLLFDESRVVLLAFDEEPPARQKKLVQYAQAHFDQVGLTHPGQELATLKLNFLPENALVVASLQTNGQSRRLIRQLLNLPAEHALSFLLTY